MEAKQLQQEIQSVFAEEAEELLETLEESLLSLVSLEQNPKGRGRTSQGESNHKENLSNAIHSIFRVVHTLKGSSGLFHFEHLEKFTHALENSLDFYRENPEQWTPEVVELLFQAKDILQELVQGYLSGEDVSFILPRAETLLQNLQNNVQDTTVLWEVVVFLKEEAFLSGLDIQKPLDWLKRHGSLKQVEPLLDRLPLEVESFFWDRAYLGFRILFYAHSFKGESIIQEAFEFWQADSEIQIQKVSSSEASVQESLSPSQYKQAERKVLRVSTEKLDKLINLVGELVLKNAQLSHFAHTQKNKTLSTYCNSMSRLVEEIRDVSMGMRMLPMVGLFRKIERAAYEAAKLAHKKVQVKTWGEEAELDKTLMEQLGDPLLHLVRNAIDHGLEEPAERVRLGKPEEGLLTLKAWHEASCMILELSDDGQGVDLEQVLQKAIERGLASSEQEYSSSEILDFLFHPGFSTKAEASELSGRGVGLDVVRQNIDSLRGSIRIDTKKGEGTTFRILVPLTLAIIDGFMVEVSQQKFVLPLDSVVECLELQEEFISNHLLNLRGEPLACLRLATLFGFSASETKTQKANQESLVVIRYNNQKAALVVDKTLGQYHTVIKPLGILFRNLPWISGATITGTGEIALILDIHSLIKQQTFIKQTSSKELEHE